MYFAVQNTNKHVHCACDQLLNDLCLVIQKLFFSFLHLRLLGEKEREEGEERQGLRRSYAGYYSPDLAGPFSQRCYLWLVAIRPFNVQSARKAIKLGVRQEPL